MKNNIDYLRFFAMLVFSIISCQITTIHAQDTLYIYKAGVVVNKHAVLQIDSMTFIAPAPPVACGAYTAPGVWKKFMCHNLGANTALDPFTYSDGINGDLYQWGRPTDGHEKRTSTTSTTLATSNTPGNANFISAPFPQNDWRSGGGNDTRWTDATKAANDPCPAGYKVPSRAQWAGVVANNSQGTWATGYKFGNNLFLPASGVRDNNSFQAVGSDGYYWSSTVGGALANGLDFISSLSYLGTSNYFQRAYGLSVRCVAE